MCICFYFRTDAERKVTNITQDQKLMQKTMASYKKKRRAIARAKKNEKSKQLPSIVSGERPSSSEAAGKSAHVTRTSRRTSNTESITPLSSTRVNLSTPSTSASNRNLNSQANSSESIDHLLEALDPPPVSGGLNRNEVIIPEHPRFLTREDVILEESEPSESDSSSDNEELDVNVKLLDKDVTPRSNVTVTGLDIRVPDTNALASKDSFLTPRSRANTHDMSFMKLVRLQQSNTLSKNLSLVDQLTKKIQPKKLPMINNGEESVSSILGVRKEKTMLRNTQSEHTHLAARTKVNVAIRGHSDTKGLVLARSTKEPTPFRRVSYTKEIEKSQVKSQLDILSQSKGNQKEVSMLQTKTWLHNSALVEHFECENTFMSDEGENGKQTPSRVTPSHGLYTPRGMNTPKSTPRGGAPITPAAHLIKNEPMLNCVRGDEEVISPPERSLTSILTAQYRRTNTRESARKYNNNALECTTPRSDNDCKPPDCKPPDCKPPDCKPPVSSSSHNHTTDASEQVSSKLPHTSQSMVASPRKAPPNDMILPSSQVDSLMSRIPATARDYRRKPDKFKKTTERDLKQVLKDEKKAIEREDLMYNDIKWRRKLARVKEVHFLGSGSPS